MSTGACSRASLGPGRGLGRGTAGCWSAANARRASAALCARRGRCRSRRRAVPSTSRADPTAAHVTDGHARPRAFGFPSFFDTKHSKRAHRKRNEHLQTCFLKVFDLFIEPEKRRHASAHRHKSRKRPGEMTLKRAYSLCCLKKKNSFEEDLRVKGFVYRSACPSVALSSLLLPLPPALPPAPFRRGERRIHGPRCALLKSGHITKPTSCVVSPPRPVCLPHRVGRRVGEERGTHGIHVKRSTGAGEP